MTETAEMMCIRCKDKPATPATASKAIALRAKKKEQIPGMYCDQCRDSAGLNFFKDKPKEKPITIVPEHDKPEEVIE
jgi:hypothetical protein